MKKLLRTLFVSMFCALAIASCVKPEEIENLQNQINEIKQENIASIESQIKAINSSITKLETTSAELKGFIEKLQQKQSELSDKDANLEKLIKALQDKDADLQSQISTLKTYVDNELKSTKDWVNATFMTLEMFNSVSVTISEIQAAISSLDTRLADLAASLEKALSDAQTDVNAKVKELSDRLEACEETVEQLLARIQSIAVVPLNSDGSVEILRANATDICFEVTPRSASVALAKAPMSVFSLDAINAETKASVFTNLPITKVIDNGEVLVITINGLNMSDGFFNGNIPMCARLKIQDGNNSRTSKFFALSPETPPYYIENGINLGKSIAVQGDWNKDGNITIMYWAPVNCGYEATGSINTNSDHRLGKLYQWGAGDSNLSYKYNGELIVAREMYYDAATPSPWYGRTAIVGQSTDVWNNNQGPCPEGWRLPTLKEFGVLCAGKNGSYGWTTSGSYAGQVKAYPGAEFFGSNTNKTSGSGVFFPAAGYRESTYGSAGLGRSYGYYWTSTLDEDSSAWAYSLNFNANQLQINGAGHDYKATGASVRCVSK